MEAACKIVIVVKDKNLSMRMSYLTLRNDYLLNYCCATKLRRR